MPMSDQLVAIYLIFIYMIRVSLRRPKIIQ